MCVPFQRASLEGPLDHEIGIGIASRRLVASDQLASDQLVWYSSLQ